MLRTKFLSLTLLLAAGLFSACASQQFVSDATAQSDQQVAYSDQHALNGDHRSLAVIPAAEWSSIQTPEWYDYTQFDTISVLAWNIEHFVDEFDNPYIDHPRENNPAENLAERRQLLADALREIDADIVVFQEVESSAFIAAFAQEYFEDLGYQLFTGRESDTWYMNVVIMSRIPLGMLYSYSNIYTYRSDTSLQNQTNNRMVSVDVLVRPGFHFLLTGVHLKAGRSETDRNWRIGQLNLLRDHYTQVLAINPEARILLAGDLNIITGHREYYHMLGQGTAVEFVDPLGDVDSFTHPADNPTRQLDYVLPNTNMKRDMVADSKQILTPFEPNTMRLISDHLPVIARFVTNQP